MIFFPSMTAKVMHIEGLREFLVLCHMGPHIVQQTALCTSGLQVTAVSLTRDSTSAMKHVRDAHSAQYLADGAIFNHLLLR